MNEQQVICVDEMDNAVGLAEKMDAHRKGLLHRAFSVFVFNSMGQMLLQQRALTKYHSPGLWSNACCSHPFPGEDTSAAAQRRLREELGFATPLENAFHFLYKAAFENGLMEYEFDHVYVGRYDGDVQINGDEVKDYRYLNIGDIKADLAVHPKKYTAWFHIAFPRVEKWMADTGSEIDEKKSSQK